MKIEIYTYILHSIQRVSIVTLGINYHVIEYNLKTILYLVVIKFSWVLLRVVLSSISTLL